MTGTPAQSDVVRALADPAFYPHRPQRVEHVQTHISHVFLAGPYVYKLKKAVRFPFVDLSTPVRRHHLCREEVRLNRRLCPTVYLDVLPVTRATDGTLALGGAGTVVEDVVWMRRLPAAAMLVHRLAAGTVPPGTIDALAALVATFHAGAPTGPEIAAHAAPERLAGQWAEELQSVVPFTGDLLAAEDREVLADFGPTFVRRHETLLRARVSAGRIREGHGDLQAQHVCVVDSPVRDAEPPLAAGIYVFDCIEFSHAFRCNDVASEIAFLVMDLECLGHPEVARDFAAAYAAAAGDPLVPVLLPFYACYRACVRGKVEGLASREAEVGAAGRAAAAAQARRHFALATRYAWAADGPAVIACCGLSGSGKSTLAAEVAAVTGFALLATDVLRGRDPGPAASAPYGAGRYTATARSATYRALCAEAEVTLAAGRGVVADATFMERTARTRLAAIARRARVPHVFVECRTAEDAVRARLTAREAAPSASDARWETYLAQRTDWQPLGDGEPHLSVDTTDGVPAARASALRQLWCWRQGRPPSRVEPLTR